MEEILASIRSIIADDRDAAQRPRPSLRRGAARLPADRLFQGRLRPCAPLRLAEPPRNASEPTRTRPRSSGAACSRRPCRSPRADAASAAMRRAASVAGDANEAVTASFSALSAGLAVQSAELADGLTREMLRPMLKRGSTRTCRAWSSAWCAPKSSGSRAAAAERQAIRQQRDSRVDFGRARWA